MANNLQTPRPPIYTDLDRANDLAESNSPSDNLVKVPEGFFAADHPNTKMMINMLNQGDTARLRSLMDRANTGSLAVFQLPDRGPSADKSRAGKSMFHRHAILYLSLIGLATYYNKSSSVAVILKEGGKSLMRSQYATNVQSGDDILAFGAEYVAVMMESFDCLGPLLQLHFWDPYGASSLLYRRRYLQSRTPIIGYPDLLRCALLRSPNYNLTGFLTSARRETVDFSLARLIYLGSLMVQHFDVNLADGTGTRRVLEAEEGPRFVMPNLCSLSRRLLTLAVYQDPHGRLLSQILGALKECLQAGAHLVTLPHGAGRVSLLLWLQELVTAEHRDQPIRSMGAQIEKLLLVEEGNSIRDHYQRYDALNCVSLLLSLQSRYRPSQPDALGFGRRIMDAACGIALQAGLAEPMLLYAWPDHLLALTSLVNPTPMASVGFEEFSRLLQRLIGHVAAASGVGGMAAFKLPVGDKKTILKLDWTNATDAMCQVMSGQLTVPLQTKNGGAGLPVSQEQDADDCRQQKPSLQFDYAAFYRQFEHRFRLWLACRCLPPNQQPQPLPLKMEFAEDRAFVEVYQPAYRGT